MGRPLVIFEDDRFSDLFPLSLTRPVFALVCGISSLADKVAAGLRAASKANNTKVWWDHTDGNPVIRFHLRDYLTPGCEGAVTSYEDLCEGCDTVTLLNGRLVFKAGLLDRIDPAWHGKYMCGRSMVMVNLPGDRISELDRHAGKVLTERVFADLPARDVEADMIAYPWDLVRMNGDEIASDLASLGGSMTATEPHPMAHLVGGENMRIGKNVRISPGVVIDATTGPVSIEDGAVLMPNASLEGPVHIGRGSIIKMGARIYGGTTVGPVCKVGGEVAETVIQGYSNKQHDGFVGHSYLGEWINLGAGTDTSDMKNNYSPVRVPVAGESVDSGELFVGLFMGDHSKTGIGSVFNTGSVVGACCNVFGGDYPPKYIPSFTWGGVLGFDEYDLEKAIATARRVMARRDETLDANAETILRKVFELTADERRRFLSR